METSIFYGPHIQDHKIIKRTISGKELRKIFCRNMVEWAIIANRKGVTLDVSFDHALPDYLLGDEKLFSEAVSGLVGSSINRTEEGIVRIAVNGNFNRDLNKCWLIITVDDTGTVLRTDGIHHIKRYSPESNDRDCRLPGKLLEKARIYGGEIREVNIAGSLLKKQGWNNRYVARLPYGNVSLGNRFFQDNYLA